jgi:hypothetical protein
VRKNYQRKERKSNHKFEVVGGEELLVRVPLPMAEMQAQVEELTGQAGLQILRAMWLVIQRVQYLRERYEPDELPGCSTPHIQYNGPF